MAKYSFLLALSGSEQSRYAAELAWKLAKELDARVTAQHVIDSRTTWELLRNDTPGFLGSGPYVNAYESVVESLRSLANKLAEKYEMHAREQAVETEVIISEGNPVAILSQQASSYDMLIIGHQPSGVKVSDHERCHYIKYSVAEGVAHESAVPILIVQGKPAPWKSLTVLSEMDHVNFMLIRSGLRLAKMLNLKPQLEFLGTGTREETPDNFKADLVKAVPEAADTSVGFELYAGQAANDRQALFHTQASDVNLETNADTLLMVPTRGVGRDRITLFGSSPDVFVRHLTLPNILFWPEEHVEFGADAKSKETVALK
ncbi:MAG TPA: universal stress protein [Candidatus Obscuribacterales bacterium]